MSLYLFRTHGKILLLTALIIGLGPLTIDMYLPAFSQIASDFQVGVDRVELSLAYYFVGLSIGQLIYGPLSDRFGRKTPLLVGLFVYTLASFACSMAPTMTSFIGLRFIQALGGCAGMVISRAVIRDLFDHRESAKAFSLLVLVMGVAPILAPVIGGQITVYFGWKVIFWTLSAIGALAFLLVFFSLSETGGARPDYRLSRAFSMYGPLFHERDFMQNCLSGGLAQAGMFAYITGSPFVLIDFLGVSPDSYGYFFGGNAVGLILASQFNSSLVDRFGPERVLRASIFSVCGFGLFLAIAGAMGAGLPVIATGLFGYMTSLGLIFPNSTAGALAHQAHRAGAASALLGSLQFVLATLSSTSVSLLHAHSAVPMTAIMGLCATLSLTTYWLLRPAR